LIRIACTNCKTILLIDDAFAGGVCRCQHCGTIQTVPAKARAGNGVASGQAMGGSKSVFAQAPRPESPMGAVGSGTGLDELASIVASSGLAGSGLSSRRLSRPAAVLPPPPPRRRVSPLLLGGAAAGLLILILLGVIAYLAMRPTPASPNAGNTLQTNVSGSPELSPSPPGIKQPNFCGTVLEGSSVVYVLDRGSGSKEIFPALEDATLKSIQSLGPGRRFQVLFWANGSDDAGYPPESTTYASSENIDAARRAIDGVAVFGASDARPAIQQALGSHPDVIVVATPKGWQLNADWASALLGLRGSSPVRIDTFSLGAAGPSEGLQTLAGKTGGQFVQVTDPQLRAAGGQ
jgi:hypothetical protein